MIETILDHPLALGRGARFVVARLQAAYPKLARAKTFELGMVRRGKPLTITITVN